MAKKKAPKPEKDGVKRTRLSTGKKYRSVYSCRPPSTGGKFSQAEAIKLLKDDLGVRAKKCDSEQPNQFGLEINATPGVHGRVSKYLFG